MVSGSRVKNEETIVGSGGGDQEYAGLRNTGASIFWGLGFQLLELVLQVRIFVETSIFCV
jgi:hypothetical protein